jgi:phosphoserine aminotransferase
MIDAYARAAHSPPAMTTHNRYHNFSAGPGALPLSVLEEAQRNFLNHEGKGAGLMEMSHRTKPFESVLYAARDTLAELYGLPDTHEVLFLQGGAHLQFAMVPLNLGAGAYVDTGVWASRAYEEAARVGPAWKIWTDKANNYRGVPAAGTSFDVPAEAKYLHYTTNNTIYGTQWHHVPETTLPLVSDMSSDFLSRPLDLGRFALVYAGAQKNAGPSGVTIVIGRKDLLRTFTGAATVPLIMRYPIHAENDSMYNTPNTFGVYMVGLVAKWVKAQGGLAGMAAQAEEKAGRIYGVLDAHPDVFEPHAAPESRSRMNLTFRLKGGADAEKTLLAAADAAGIVGLKGHRSVGGLRASLYNAVPRESVEALARLLEDFAKR